MDLLKTSLPGLSVFPSLAIPFKLFPYAVLKQMVYRRIGGAGPALPGFTNMGIIESELLDFPGTKVEDAFLAGAVNYPPSFQLGFTSFKETLTFSVCSCGKEHNGLAVTSVLDMLDEELPG
jgi:NRPS condensation-like uncharacterized protein